MKKEILALAATILILSLIACSSQTSNFEFVKDDLEVINRDIESIDDSRTSLKLNNKMGDGMVILHDAVFDEGLIELEIKGEDNPGRSFVGLAFNIQNDSTYEAVYFRPFNFQSDEKIKREHSVQYVFHPKNTWRYLRTNYEGKYEAEYPRQPLPNDWFAVCLKINESHVVVYDQESKTELLSIERLAKQVSNKIGLWTGNNSKGEFRNLKIIE